MKIAICGSAPSSVGLAPYGNPEWKIWGCSPGLYSVAPRTDAWFELHRWEPGIIGKPETQKPWFSPEYCAWMARQPLVWMYEPVPEIPNSRALPVSDLVLKYGSFFFTSSIAWMFALAIEEIKKRKDDENEIGLWGVDMSASEEYGYQRAGCQFFVQLAIQLGIKITIPSESDLMQPATLYGISESDPKFIKLLSRKRELQTRLTAAEQNMQNAQNEAYFLRGAISDLEYHIGTWIQDGSKTYGCNFKELFSTEKSPTEKSPDLKVVND